MKTLLLFFFPCIALSQVADFQLNGDTLLLQNTGLIRHAVSITITNENGKDVWVQCSLDDTTDFAFEAIGLDAIPLGQKRQINIYARRTLWHDTVLTVTLKTNSLFQHNGEFVAVIQGKASYLGVESVSRSLGARKQQWRTVMGELADTTKSGIYYTFGNRKVVVR